MNCSDFPPRLWNVQHDETILEENSENPGFHSWTSFFTHMTHMWSLQVQLSFPVIIITKGSKSCSLKCKSFQVLTRSGSNLLALLERELGRKYVKENSVPEVIETVPANLIYLDWAYSFAFPIGIVPFSKNFVLSSLFFSPRSSSNLLSKKGKPCYQLAAVRWHMRVVLFFIWCWCVRVFLFFFYLGIWKRIKRGSSGFRTSARGECEGNLGRIWREPGRGRNFHYSLEILRNLLLLVSWQPWWVLVSWWEFEKK